MEIVGTSSTPCFAVQTSGPKHRVPDCRPSSALDAQTSLSGLFLPDAVQPAMPAIVITALAKPLKPSIMAMRCFTPGWSSFYQIIRLFRYRDERSFASAGSEPSAFSSRTAR